MILYAGKAIIQDIDEMDNWEGWLNDYLNHQVDELWINDHISDIIDALFHAIANRKREIEAIQGIIHLYPYIIKQRKTADLSQHLQDALLIMQERRDAAGQMRIWARIGHTRQLQGRNTAMAVGVDVAMDYVADDIDRLEMMFTLCELFYLLAERQATDVPLLLVNKALTLVAQFHTEELYGDLLSSLCAAYTNSGDKHLAFKYGEKALGIWMQRGKTVRAAQVARMMASAARLEPYCDYDTALHFLDIAADLYAITNDQRQYVVVNYEKGVLEFLRAHFDRALELFMVAKHEYHATQQNSPALLASISHCLGLTYIHLERYRLAAKHLRAALRLWEFLQDNYQIASNYNDVGYMLLKRGWLQSGWRWLMAARHLCSRLPMNRRATWLFDRITENLNLLENITQDL